MKKMIIFICNLFLLSACSNMRSASRMDDFNIGSTEEKVKTELGEPDYIDEEKHIWVYTMETSGPIGFGTRKVPYYLKWKDGKLIALRPDSEAVLAITKEREDLKNSFQSMSLQLNDLQTHPNNAHSISCINHSYGMECGE